jgi:hypothetical protein
MGKGILRFFAANLLASLVELANYTYSLGLVNLPTLEPLPVGALCCGVLLGWAGVAGFLTGDILSRFVLYDLGPWQNELNESFYRFLGIPMAYTLLGVVGLLVFHLISTGRGAILNRKAVEQGWANFQ